MLARAGSRRNYRDWWLCLFRKLPLESKSDFYIAGEFDHLAKLSDGSHAVIDDKTSSANPMNLLPEKQSATYSSQVNAYAYALEKPANEKWIDNIFNSGNHINSLRKVPKTTRQKMKVSRLGLNNFAISRAEIKENGRFDFITKRVWSEVGKNYSAPLNLAQQIANITNLDLPPNSSSNCHFCKDFTSHNNVRIESARQRASD